MLIDSHCHLDRLNGVSVDAALQAAEALDVTYFLCPGVALNESAPILELAKQYPKKIVAAIGSHPTEEITKTITAAQIIELADRPEVVAIGETGLDYYPHTDELTDEQKAMQVARFREHIHAAQELKKPLIIHSRNAKEATLQILQEEGAANIGGVMHCFTYDWAFADEVIKLGFYIGISGIVTFKNAHTLREVVVNLPFEKILLETDAPYLAPTPYRGKPNMPAYLFYIAEQVAQLKGVSLQVTGDVTSENFWRLF